MSKVEEQENPQSKVRENEKLISLGWVGGEGQVGSGGVSDLAWTQEGGARWETGTVKCDVLSGIYLVSGVT